MDLKDVLKALPELSDQGLEMLSASIRGEQHDRLARDAEPLGLIEKVFEEGFDSKGVAKDPWYIGDLIVIPGSSINKSASSHRCRYANIALPEDEQGSWVWDSEMLVDSEDGHKSRYLSNNAGKRTASVITPVEGMQIDMISSNFSGNSHEMQKSTCFRVEGGQLVLVRTRKKAQALGHNF